MNVVQLVYAVLSVVVVALVVWFGVGRKSNYVPQREQDQDERRNGGESSASVN
jgi:hypothetical protein